MGQTGFLPPLTFAWHQLVECAIVCEHSSWMDDYVCVLCECAIVCEHSLWMDDSVCLICECAIVCEHNSWLDDSVWVHSSWMDDSVWSCRQQWEPLHRSQQDHRHGRCGQQRQGRDCHRHLHILHGVACHLLPIMHRWGDLSWYTQILLMNCNVIFIKHLHQEWAPNVQCKNIRVNISIFLEGRL